MGDSGKRNPAAQLHPTDAVSQGELFDWRTFDPRMLPGGLDAPLAVELVTYRDRLDEMLPHHEGDFVVIKNDRIEGYYGNRKAALRAAFKLFCREPVLIKKVIEKEPVRRIGSVVG
jgi:hypothetical protein